MLLLLFPTLLILDLILRLSGCKCSLKASKRIEKALFWNSTIRFIKESYAIALMCCFINIKAFTWNTIGEGVSSSLTVFLIFISILFPIAIAIALNSNYHQLKHPQVKEIFGASYDHMKLRTENDPERSPKEREKGKDTKSQFLFFAIFYYLRRYILALSVIYLQ